MERVTGRVKKSWCSMTIVGKTRSNGLKQQEDQSNVIGLGLISRNGLKMNRTASENLRFFKNRGN